MTQVLAAPALPGFSYLRDLGSGGFADVFLYQQEQPYRQVAVKVLRDTTVSTRARQMFAAEANSMAQLEHPYIVRVYSTGTTADNRPYIVMSYYPNGSLAPRVRRQALSVEETLKVGIEIGAAVETAHRARILHRDIKPANILLDPYDQPGLTDFGIAGQIAAADDDDSGLSVPWAPPELLYSTGAASVQSDVYALAATLWHLLVGRSPFEVPGGNNSVYELMKRVRDQPVPSTGRRDVPLSLDRLLKQAMSKQPNQRPSSVYELIMSLQAIEGELSLRPTQIRVARAGGAGTRQDSATTSDRTKVQAPQRIDPAAGIPAMQAWPARTQVPAWRSEPESGEQTVLGPAVGDPGIIRAGQGIEQTRLKESNHEPVEEAPARRGTWRAVVIVGVLVLVIAGIGTTLMLTGSGGKAAAPVAASEPPPTAQVGGDALPPGVPVIKGQRTGSDVTFTWTYSAAEDTDTYRYRLSDQTIANTDKRSVTLSVPEGREACLEVMVYRTNGQSSRNWSPKVCVK